MAHHSKFPLFAFLALICTAVSGCSVHGPQYLTCDPKQTEEIARQSAVNSAHIIFNDGDSVKGYRVGIRKDTTEWYEKDSLGNLVSDVRHVAPTSDISAISISTPEALDHMLIGAAVGAVLGALIYEGAKNSDAPGQDESFGDQLVNGIALGIGFKWCTIGMGSLCAVGGLVEGAGVRKDYYVDPMAGQPIHWFNAQTDSTKVDTTAGQPIHWFVAEPDSTKVDTTAKADTTKFY